MITVNNDDWFIIVLAVKIESCLVLTPYSSLLGSRLISSTKDRRII